MIDAKGRLYGYARVSTDDQDLTIQMEALKQAGCTVIRHEKVSATKMDGRTELGTLLQFLRAGDTLVVTRIDRLARSMRDLQNVVHDLDQRGVALKATEQPVDTRTPEGKAFLGMLGVFAQFETEIRRERQLEGVKKAKADGKFKGGKRRIDHDAVRRMYADGKRTADIARDLGIDRRSVYGIRMASEKPNALTSLLD